MHATHVFARNDLVFAGHTWTFMLNIACPQSNALISEKIAKTAAIGSKHSRKVDDKKKIMIMVVYFHQLQQYIASDVIAVSRSTLNCIQLGAILQLYFISNYPVRLPGVIT